MALINFEPEKFDKIVIFLHGYGANGNDLISLEIVGKRTS